MPKITAWKCPHTGKLFEREAQYRSHLARLSRQRSEQRRLAARQEIESSWWRELQNSEIDVADLPDLIIREQDHFWRSAARKESWHWDKVGKKSRRGVVMPVPRLVRFTSFFLQWQDCVSNSHYCPRDGVTNWGGYGRLPDGTPAPQGYPGWMGRMEWDVEWPREWDGWYPGGDLFAGADCCIHTGTGGGGGWRNDCQSFGYDIRMFAADWPGPARLVEKQRVWQILST